MGRPARPARPETVFQRNRHKPERLNNSLRRTYDLLRSTLQSAEGTVCLVEGELMDALSASRNTVRAVLQQMARDGLVTRSPKRGTQSAEQFLLRLNSLSPVRELASASTIHTELRALEIQTVGCPPMVRERLALPTDFTVLMIEGLLTHCEVPMGITVSYIALNRRESQEVVVDEPDAILFMEKHLGAKITSSRTTIGATAADAQSAELIGVELGAPMIFLEDVLEDEKGRPRAISQFRLRSDRVAFQADAFRAS
jgi:GntR family transcriptional regulator